MSSTAVFYTLSRVEGREQLTVVVTEVSQVRTLTDSNPNFAKVKEYCETHSGRLDAEKVLALIDAGLNAVNKLQELTDRVSYRDGVIYLDGDPIEDALSAHLVRMVEEGDTNLGAYANFLTNLASNPSPASRASLFEWVADRHLTITPEGEFVAYKGVSPERKSGVRGHGFVDGEEVKNDYLTYNDGSVVTIPRSEVDEYRESACSFGLHVGTRSYAQGYGSVMLAVAVNPRDVVMVPRDGGGEKMRVCRLRVLGENTEELTQTTYGEEETPEDSGTCPFCDFPLDENGECGYEDDPDHRAYEDEDDDDFAEWLE